jgi:hypothetical protein
MPKCLDVRAWRLPTNDELIEFVKNKWGNSLFRHSQLVIRTRISQVDMYAYLRARFGVPNGFQNFLRSNDSDNLVHWDFALKAGDVDICIQGIIRDVVIVILEPMADEDWKALILALKAEFGRIGSEKSQMLKSFEKFVVFQNKFAVLAQLCGELHASIADAPAATFSLPRITTKKSARAYNVGMKKITTRATNLFGDCLKLRLLTPIMAEAFINMLILTLCKLEIRKNTEAYDAFVREKIPRRLALLNTNCVGFMQPVNQSTDACKDFLRVMNARNFAVHGNVDPIREQIETVYFEGKRPLFQESGDHVLKFFEHLEGINAPQIAAKDYENVHMFLTELHNLLEPQYRRFFEIVIADAYPGYEVKDKRVTKILPSHNAAMLLPYQKYDYDLKVVW